MGTSAIDGLVSGLDTTALISNLIRLEAAPQTLLKGKQSTSTNLVTALQSLNTKIASLAATAATAAKATSWTAYTAKSSSTSATATATAGAQAGSMTFSVDQVATSQVSVSQAVPDDGTLAPGAVTIKKADGTYLTVSPASGNLADVAKAINDAADAGVRATVVRVSAGGYRIQFTGATTGSDGAFKVFAGTQADVEALPPGDETLRIDTSPVQTAQNAQITLWKGLDAQTTFNQSSNTFTGLMTGVDITVTKPTAVGEDVTVTVAQDGAALQKLASDLVGSLGIALSEIASRTKTTSTTASDGRTVVTGGLFAGDSGVRQVSQQLLSAISMPADGFSPSEVGIVLGKDGTVTFDAAKFTAALAADPAKVQSMVTQIADRAATAAKGASDPTVGVITSKVTGQQALVRDFGLQIEDWDRRLAIRQLALEKTYSALEVSLSKLNSQSSWLTSQLDALKSSSGS